MKKVLLFLVVICVCTMSNAQLPMKDNNVVYEGIITVEGVEKDVLFDRIQEWFVKTYNSANDVIQIKDKENGKIMGKGVFSVNYYQRKPTISHTISVFVRDGRFKYVIDQIGYKDVQGDSFVIENFPKSWAGKEKLYETVDKRIKSYISGLEQAALKESQNENEDW